MCHRLWVLQVYWQWRKHPRSIFWAAVVMTTQWCWLLFFMSSVAELLCFVCVRRAAVNAVRNLCLILAFLFVIAVMKRVKVSYLSTYTFFKDIFRLDMEQVLSWCPSCRHWRNFFFSHRALTVKEGHGKSLPILNPIVLIDCLKMCGYDR